MPGPRSKRKRTESEAAPPSSRRRGQRDPTNSGLEVSPATNKPKSKKKAANDAALDDSKSSAAPSKSEKLKADPSAKFPAATATASAALEGNDHANSEAEPTKTKKGPLHEEKQWSKKEAQLQQQSAAPVSRRSSKTSAEKISGSRGTNAGATATTAAATGAASSAASGGKQNASKQTSRERRIRGLISHRKLILERLQQGRTAAQNRISELEAEQTATQRSETADQERLRFAAMCKEVTSLARRQSTRVDATTQPTDGAEGAAASSKRTSLSLRKGSTVGKRMNAAISALAPGSAAAAPSAAAAAGVDLASAPADPAVTSKPPAVLPMSRSQSVPVSSSQAPRVTAQSASSSVQPTSVHPSMQPTAAATKRSSTVLPAGQPAPPPVATERRVSQKSLHRASSLALQQHHQYRTSQGAFVHNTNRSNVATPATIPPNVAGLPIMRRPMPPVVVVPEAAALRERRKLIEQKLIALSTRKEVLPAPRRSGIDVAGPQNTAAHRQSDVNSLSRAARDFATKGAPTSTAMPERRKTHWDTLLEEMRWMATDFIEERKWKHSASRVLADAVRADGRRRRRSSSLATENGGDNVASEKAQTTDHQKPAGAIATISVSTTESNLQSGPAENGTAEHRDNDGAGMMNNQQAQRRGSNELEARERARKTSSQVSDFWSSRIGGTSDDLVGEGKDASRKKSGSSTGLSSDAKQKSSEYAKLSANLEKLLHEIRAVEDKGHNPSNLGNLTSQQGRAVQFSEEAWRKANVGCLFSGPCSSGKTYAACGVLWTNKDFGPQIVVCSPDSLLRWKNELCSFGNLRVRCGFEGSSARFESDTVTICTFQDLTNFARNGSISQFKVMVVDSRYPVGFRGSRPKVCLDKYENASHSLLSLSAPKELASTDWWESVATIVKETGMRRFLVDPFDAGGLLGLFDGMSNRAILEHLALRAAFLVGGSVVPAGRESLRKNILGWARWHIKRTDVGGSKFAKVRDLFCSMLDAVTTKFSVESQAPYTMEVVPCELTAEQVTSYSLCRGNVKSILSRPLDDLVDVDFPFRSIADAFMRLRKICTHADIKGALTSLAARSHLTNHRRSGSQPDSQLATFILAGSGKLKELVRIIAQETHLALAQEVEEVVNVFHHKRKADSRPRKVAVLAVLPEVQLLVSLLFGALGIAHEVLINARSTSGNKESSAEWMATQLILSRFNDKDMTSPAVNVVVASPISVAGNHGGLGVESADVVLLVDEDWSGRGELLMKALLSRLASRKKGANCRLCRLVAMRTCEESFLMDDVAGATEHPPYIPWPVSAFGLFYAPKDLKQKEEATVRSNWTGLTRTKGLFSFPVTRLISQSNSRISTVLGTGDSGRRLFGTLSDPLFLPSSDPTLKTDTQMRLTENLFRAEDECASVSTNFPFGVHPVSASSPFPDDFVRCDSADAAIALPVMAYLRRSESFFDHHAPQQATLSLQNHPAGVGETIEDQGDPIPLGEASVSAGDLLTYDANTTDQGTAAGCNAFASTYGSSRDLQSFDGRRGKEMLVYFPPIFPRLLESSIIAEESVWALRRSNKRAMVTSSARQSASKRMKSADGEFLPVSLTADPSPVITEETASQNDAASVLLDLTDDYGLAGIGAIPLPRDSALFAGQVAHGGCGTQLGDGNFDTSHLPSDLADAEEMRCGIRPDSSSIILFVGRKRPRGRMGNYLLPQQSHPNNTFRTHHGNNGVMFGMNGVEQKKMKKKAALAMDQPGFGSDQQPHTVSIPARSLAGSAPSGSAQVTKMDIQRSRLIAASHHSGAVASLFESAPFRAACIRLNGKMKEHLSRVCWQTGSAFEAGPGLPLLVSKPQSRSQGFRGHFDTHPALWTSVVKRLKNPRASTGDEAIEISLNQRSSLRKSLVAPSRVDLGPFNAGFLFSPSGMTAISPPRPTLGVTLPMGVKLPQTVKDQVVPWTEREELLLQETSLHFGTNWTLASRVLSGLQDVITVSRQPHSKRPVPRAAKSCRDHWQALARNDPTLTKEVRRVGRTQRENSTLKFRDSADPGLQYRTLGTKGENEAPIFLLLGESTEKQKSRTSDQDDKTRTQADGTRRQRSFSAITSARRKVQNRPAAVPGMSSNTSSAQQTAAPSHSSHIHSVQASVASSWTSGRTELWPLQFLDAADRFRASQSHQTPTASGVSPRSPSASAASSRQHSGGAPRTSSSLARQQQGVLPPGSVRSTSASSYPQQPPSSLRGSSSSSNNVPQNTTVQSFAPPPSQQPSSSARQNGDSGSPAT